MCLTNDQHCTLNAQNYREKAILFYLQVNLWGLDAIKTKGESVAIVLYLVGARPLREATGRVARYELIPLDVSDTVATQAVVSALTSESVLPPYTSRQCGAQCSGQLGRHQTAEQATCSNSGLAPAVSCLEGMSSAPCTTLCVCAGPHRLCNLPWLACCFMQVMSKKICSFTQPLA